VTIPPQLLMRDLLRLRVRCSQGLDRGAGVAVWMHPPVHRVLGWVSRPSAFGDLRLVWRLDQLRAVGELEALVKGEPAETDADTVRRLPTLFEAALLDRRQQPIGAVADALVELRSGRILDYQVSRSDPRLPGSSRWRLSPERIVDQQPGRVFTNLEGLDDLPLARASVRQTLLRRSRRWREQVQDAGQRFEQRMEGWLEEPPWEEPEAPWHRSEPDAPRDRREEPRDRRYGHPPEPPASGDPDTPEPWDDQWLGEEPDPPLQRRPSRSGGDDPWI
jgi:hypothetical protein